MGSPVMPVVFFFQHHEYNGYHHIYHKHAAGPSNSATISRLIASYRLVGPMDQWICERFSGSTNAQVVSRNPHRIGGESTLRGRRISGQNSAVPSGMALRRHMLG